MPHCSEGSNYGATGRNSSDQIGRAGFNRAMAIVAGGVPEKETALPSPIITKDNAIKFYDHQNVLRIETTINNPREFKVLRAIDQNGTSLPAGMYCR